MCVCFPRLSPPFFHVPRENYGQTHRILPPNSSTPGPFPGLARIISEEGLLRLWTPGLVATWLRALTQTGLRVGLYPRRG